MIFYSALGCIGVIKPPLRSLFNFGSFPPFPGPVLLLSEKRLFERGVGKGAWAHFSNSGWQPEHISTRTTLSKMLTYAAPDVLCGSSTLELPLALARVFTTSFSRLMAANPLSPPSGNIVPHATLSVSLCLGSHFTLHHFSPFHFVGLCKDQPRGLLDREKRLIFLLSHSRSRLRVRGERQSRKKRGRKPERRAFFYVARIGWLREKKDICRRCSFIFTPFDKITDKRERFG